jgi:hypothetical protein
MVEPERARLESLAPARRAVLVLLASQNRSYSDIARLLATDESDIRARAFVAAEELLAGAVPAPEEDVRRRLVDYALGQQSVSERQRTREMLAESPVALAWLAELEQALGLSEPPARSEPAATGDSAPPAPSEPAATGDSAPPAPSEPAATGDSAPPSSPVASARTHLNRPSAYLLAGVIAIVIGIVLLLVGGPSSPNATAQIPSARAITISRTSSVPSPIVRIFASR